MASIPRDSHNLSLTVLHGFRYFFPGFIARVPGFTALTEMLTHSILLAFYWQFVTLCIFFGSVLSSTNWTLDMFDLLRIVI